MMKNRSAHYVIVFHFTIVPLMINITVKIIFQAMMKMSNHTIFQSIEPILIMTETEHNKRIKEISEMIISDNLSLDEQDQNKLEKYHNFLKQNYSLDHDSAVELVNEAFLYLKLKESPDIDPLTKGDEFGAGFSQLRTIN